MIVLVSSIVLLRELLVSTIFRMVDPYIAIQSVERFLHLFHTFIASRSYVHAHVSAAPRVIERK